MSTAILSTPWKNMSNGKMIDDSVTKTFTFDSKDDTVKAMNSINGEIGEVRVDELSMKDNLIMDTNDKIFVILTINK